MRFVCLVVFCCAFWPVAPYAADQTSVHDLSTRPGVAVRLLVIKPERLLATVLLFPGGFGRFAIEADGSTGYRGFPVRNRELFVKHGFMTAAINAPSDRLPDPALHFFRDTAAHAEDVRQAIVFLRKEANVPVWLVGHSAGAISMANAAIRLRDGGPDGIVLMSSVNGKFYRYSTSLDGLDIEEITVPTLVSNHEDDECEWKLFRHTRQLIGRLKKAPKSELVSFTGGGPVSGNPCSNAHYHSFPGIEPEVISRVADWIRATLKH